MLFDSCILPNSFLAGPTTADMICLMIYIQSGLVLLARSNDVRNPVGRMMRRGNSVFHWCFHEKQLQASAVDFCWQIWGENRHFTIDSSLSPKRLRQRGVRSSFPLLTPTGYRILRQFRQYSSLFQAAYIVMNSMMIFGIDEMFIVRTSSLFIWISLDEIGIAFTRRACHGSSAPSIARKCCLRAAENVRW
jgi:hypothetical protein